MIPLLAFVALLLIMIPLFIYSFVDSRNKFYANIVSAFLVALIAGYLGVVISIGIVQYDPTLTFNGTFTTEVSDCLQWETINQTRECIEYNNYTVTNSICQTCNGIPIKDASFGYIMLLFSVIMMIYTMYMIYDAYDEHRMEKEGT